MSRSVKQYIWGAVILAIAMVFVMQFRPGAQLPGAGPEGAGPTCAVETDGRCIVSQSDYLATFRLLASGNVEEDSKREMIRQLVLEGLVQRWLLLEDAARLGLAVSEAEVTQELARGLVRVSLPADHENDMLSYQFGLSQLDGAARAVPFKDPKTDKFDYERYKKWVQRISGKTLQDFREFATKEELAARMRAAIKSRAHVGDEEAHAEFVVTNSKIVVDYLALNQDWYQRQVDASDAVVATWTAANTKDIDEAFAAKKDQFLPGCRTARQLLVRIDDSGDKVSARKKADEKLAVAKKRLDGGEPFADVARALSEDSKSAPEGGWLGCFAAGKLVQPNTAKAVDDAIYATAKGKLSGTIETNFGLHLVTVDEVFEGDGAAKEGRREVARERFIKNEADRLAAEAARELTAAVKGGKTLQQAADAHLAAHPVKGAKADDSARPLVATSSEFTLGGSPFPGIESPLQAAHTLFALEVDGVPVEPIKTYTGYVVARVKEKKALEQKEWDEKRGPLLDSLRQDKQRDGLIAYVHVLRAKYAKTLTYLTKAEKKSGQGDDGKKGQKSPPPAESEGNPLDE